MSNISYSSSELAQAAAQMEGANDALDGVERRSVPNVQTAYDSGYNSHRLVAQLAILNDSAAFNRELDSLGDLR